MSVSGDEIKLFREGLEGGVGLEGGSLEGGGDGQE